MAKKTRIELADIQIEMFKETARQLDGQQKRIFMAQVVERLGYGGQRFAEEFLGWNRITIRRGKQELEARNRARIDGLSQPPIPNAPKRPEISPEMAKIYIETADQLSGTRRRIFMGQVVSGLGKGGQRYAEKVLGWNRATIRKGMQELEAQRAQGRRRRDAEAQSEIPISVAKRPSKRGGHAVQRGDPSSFTPKPIKIASLTPEMTEIYVETANNLSGQRRRIFMAQVVLSLGPGGQRLAERELGWNRKTIRLGIRDLNDRSAAQRRLSQRGRKSIETKLPRFTEDIRQVLHRYDPEAIETKELSISIKKIMQALVEERGYRPEDLPLAGDLSAAGAQNFGRLILGDLHRT